MTDSITFRDGKPAIDVKDRRTYHQQSAGVKDLIDALPAETVQDAYESAQSLFWRSSAPSAAHAHGYGAAYPDGRSSGWLLVDKPPTLDYDEGDELGLSKFAVSAARAEWLMFEKEIEQEIEGARAFFEELLAGALIEYQTAKHRGEIAAAMLDSDLVRAVIELVERGRVPRAELQRIVLDHGDFPTTTDEEER